MRLIDADALEELIYTLIKSWDKNMPYGGGRIDSYLFVISAIKEAPTINKCDNCNLMFDGYKR